MKIQLIIIFSILSLSFFSQRSIHERWSVELRKYVDTKGQVDYVNWYKNKEGLNAYIIVLKQNHPQEYWSKNQIKAYWINTYNALTIKIILDNFPIKSIKDIKNPWNDIIIKYDSKSYSLDEIEHNILRKMNDPRIHFAINCASISCPKLLNKAYMPHKVEKQLDQASKRFLKSSNEIDKNEIKISKIFLWFKKDFGNTKNLLNFIEKYSSIKLANPKIKYLEYNWKLNIIQ
tara:strand:- start:775 stop:1470 length:696 start_codon:yes stop_codon:yes gene_type:complete